MNCDQALVFISAALDGELTEFEKMELERHLSDCPDCRALSEDFGVISVALSAMYAQPPADLIERVSAVLEEEQPAAAPKKVRPWRKWGSMVAMLAVVLCLGGVYLFSDFGGNVARDAAMAPQPSSHMQSESIAAGDYAGEADMDAGEQVQTEGMTEYGSNASAEFAPAEVPVSAPVMDTALTAEEAAARVLEYLGGTDTYPDMQLQGEEYVLALDEEKNTSSKTVLRYIGLSENGCYYTFQTYCETTDEFVVTFSYVNHYAVKLDGSELLVEHDEAGGDNAEAFRAALSE